MSFFHQILLPSFIEGLWKSYCVDVLWVKWGVHWMVGWSVCLLVGWLVGLFKSPTPFKSAALKPFWRYLELELFRLDSLSVCLTVCWNKEKRHQQQQHPHHTHNTWSYVWCFKYGMAWLQTKEREAKSVLSAAVFLLVGGEIKGEMSVSMPDSGLFGLGSSATRVPFCFRSAPRSIRKDRQHDM